MSVDPASEHRAAAARAAAGSVEDPELPISLAELGVLRSVTVVDATVRIVLRPTRLGCPARDEIARRVRVAVAAEMPELAAEIEWDTTAAWTPEELTPEGRRRLAEIGVVAATDQPRCPYCGADELRSAGPYGGTLCSSPWTCLSCGSMVDMMRGITTAVPTPTRRAGSGGG